MLEQVFLHQKQHSLRLRKEPLATRLEHLTALEKSIERHQEKIVAALQADFKKPAAETLLTEIYPVLKEIQHVKKNLTRWAHPEKVARSLLLLTTTSFIYKEPRGVCLIIGPWNYPLQLILTPLVSALAAGNCAILKPSEFTTHTSRVLAQIVRECFSENHVALVQGGAETTQDLLKLPFDHIFFTGSTRVGKIVMEAASRHLSSVTLELGGKSPTIVDASADIEVAAEKIAWAKFVNASQTCIAPDYVLVEHAVYERFKKALIKKINAFYGGSPLEQKNSPDYASIVSSQHTIRLKSLIEDAVTKKAEIAYGGEVDIEKRFVAPTLLEKVDLHSNVMKEEIFGPLLPLIPFQTMNEAVHFINERPKPLALYMYSHSKLNIDDVLQATSAGGVCINDSVIHFSHHGLPFGGVQESGLGHYHGIFGFKAFSHEKAVLKQSSWGKFMRLVYPPYTPFKLDLIRKILKWKL